MISLLVTILILVLVFGVIFWAIDMIPAPANLKTIAKVILALILVLVLLDMVFGSGGFPVGGYGRPLLR